MDTSCDHCGCSQVLHENERDECTSCSCVQYLDRNGQPLPPMPNNERNLITPDKFRRAGIRPGRELWIRLKNEPNRGFRVRFDSWGEALPLGVWVVRASDEKLLRAEWADMLECRVVWLQEEKPVPRFIEYHELVEARKRLYGTADGHKPKNLDMPEAFLAANVAPGTKLHLAVVGNHVTNEAIFLKKYVIPPPVVAQDYMEDHFAGIVVRLNGAEHELAWGDIVECWPVPEEVDPRYADGRPPPEIASKP
jgi:hypothetical protein